MVVSARSAGPAGQDCNFTTVTPCPAIGAESLGRILDNSPVALGPRSSRSRHTPAAEAGFSPVEEETDHHGRQPTLDPPPAWFHLGRLGTDDERGRLNLLTPEKVLQGIAEVKTGKTFCLSLPLDYPGGAILSPRRHPPVLKPTMRGDKPNMNYPLRCDDPNRHRYRLR